MFAIGSSRFRAVSGNHGNHIAFNGNFRTVSEFFFNSSYRSFCSGGCCVVSSMLRISSTEANWLTVRTR